MNILAKQNTNGEQEKDLSEISEGQLSLQDLNVVFHSARGEEVHAVKDFSLETEPGEFVCLVGPSGCGKSTVLHVIGGFVPATSGEVTVDGELITKPGPDRGVVFQQYALFPWLTVKGNVEFGLKEQGVEKNTASKIVKDNINQVGLTGFEEKYPHELSGGMQQRVAIARILASNPTVMLMDEPFGALDAQMRGMMQELLLKVWEQHRTTVFFITHDLDEALYLADTIYIMTARPGMVKEIIRNPLPRPRTAEVLSSETYSETRLKLIDSIHDEIIAALADQFSSE
jgi:NitT/TauT family transport system ATP-binding protein